MSSIVPVRLCDYIKNRLGLHRRHRDSNLISIPNRLVKLGLVDKPVSNTSLLSRPPRQS
jgi:hypothetical protein